MGKKNEVIQMIGSQVNENFANCIWDIALICKHADYPEDLEDIYDVLSKYGIDYRKVSERE